MISSVRLRGFQAHTDSTLSFSKGVNVILGDTDVGKSAIVRALGWVVFNRPSGESFVNQSAALCEVEVQTDRGAIFRSRKPSNRYMVNTNEYTAIGRTVPEDLQTVLHLSELNFQRQLEPYFLVSETPGNISKFISDILGLATVDTAISLAKTRTDALRRKIEEVETDIAARTDDARKLEPALTLEEQVKSAAQIASEHRINCASKTKLESTLFTVGQEQVAIATNMLIVAKLKPIQTVHEDMERIRAFGDTLVSLKGQHGRITTFVTNLATSQRALTTARALVAQINSESLLPVYDAIMHLYTRRTALQQVMTQLQNGQEACAVAGRELTAASAAVTDVLQQYEALLQALGVCPICHRPMTEDVCTQVLETIC